LRDLKVYTTYPHRCSYLEGEEATTLFIDPRQRIDQALYTNLSLLGFRRSGSLSSLLLLLFGLFI
jgi:arginine-tRNA-protein transferase